MSRRAAAVAVAPPRRHERQGRSVTVVRPRVGRVAKLLAAAAAEAGGVDAEHIFSPDRHAGVTLARHLAMTVARRNGYSLPEIGLAFERNHTSVIYAVREVERRAARDPEVAESLAVVERAFTNALDSGDFTLRKSEDDARYREAVEALVVTTAERDLLAADVERLVAECEQSKATTSAVRGELRVLRRQLDRARRRLEARAATRKRHYQDGRRAGLADAQRILERREATLNKRRAQLRATIAEVARLERASVTRYVLVGHYDTPAGRRRVVLAINATERTILDTGARDERVIECCESRVALAQITAVATDYLRQSERTGRPA